MSRISSCAACHGDILIPGSVQPLDQMRCPLCNAQFQVRDVLPASIMAPPEAIRVEPPIEGIAAAVGPRLSRGEPPVEWETAVAAAAPRPRKKQAGIFSHLFGIVGGGLLGLSLGYVGLLRYGGPRYDFLEVGGKLPPWVTAPIPWHLLQGHKEVDDKPPANDRALKDLLDAPEAPPAVEVPPAMPPGIPARPPWTELPPDSMTDIPPYEPPPGTAPATTEPLPLAPPAEPPPAQMPLASAAPISPPTNIPPSAPSPYGPRTFTAYSAEDLTLALNEVSAAIKCPNCQGTGQTTRTVVNGAREVKGARVAQTSERGMPCEICGGHGIAKMSPELYARLCHLAEVVTFVSKGDNSSWNQRDGVQQLLAQVGGDQKGAEAIGRLAGFQLDQMHHRNPGIALAGTVQEMSQVGNLYGMRIVLFGLPKVVTVVSWRPAQPAIKEHDRVIILGSIVENPVENLVGYEGRLPQVVWGGLPVRLPPQP